MLRVTCCSEMTDNSIQIKKDLEMFVYQLRIEAEVHVEEMVRVFYDSLLTVQIHMIVGELMTFYIIFPV